MGLLKAIGDLREGIKLGEIARELFTDLRVNKVSPYDAEKPESPFYERTQQLEGASENESLWIRIGVFIGQMEHPKEWYRNAEYLFGRN